MADDISTTKSLDKVWLQTIAILYTCMLFRQLTTLDECTSTYKKIALSMLPANWFVQDDIETIIFYVQHHSLSEDTD